MTKEEKLDQEDQRIKAVELDKLEEISDGHSSIVRGDWLRRIKPTILDLSKCSSQCWKHVTQVVEDRYQKYLLSTPIEWLHLE